MSNLKSRSSNIPLEYLKLPLWVFSYLLIESIELFQDYLLLQSVERRNGKGSQEGLKS
ncbi:hypothetical protein LEP1GSC021_1894 [Leptospira noguchii str. 1993005606]|uniref:Uncharacterized protein n=1 Tax=Leptospira noguchii str. 2001034031 TaxID=1193053 RepID=M6Y8T9_9LEPT|nr:hypothetical protein LEP1GSC024_4152 [Leptospira noguchii str. 2001034031]EPE86396.1 hypothetical protein LEP1GSC021_1894 [Leptospira noguchii str. 1993005606]